MNQQDESVVIYLVKNILIASALMVFSVFTFFVGGVIGIIGGLIGLPALFLFMLFLGGTEAFVFLRQNPVYFFIVNFFFYCMLIGVIQLRLRRRGRQKID